MNSRLGVLLAFSLIGVLGGADAPRTGMFTDTFTERSPLSAYPALAAIFGWGPTPHAAATYLIAEEPFAIHVPAAYDGSEPWGLVVFINAGTGGCTEVYPSLMSPHKLLWIGATKVPNERPSPVRFGLALDAVANMAKRYRIDPRRIYLSGLSGGGRCASMVAPTHPEVFTGGIYLVGCNAPTLPVDKARQELVRNHRFAFLTGETDFNRADTIGVSELYRAIGCKHTLLIEEPGLGHQFPSAASFDQALTFLDAPLLAQAEQALVQARALAAKSKPAEAYQALVALAAAYPIAPAARTARDEAAALTDPAEAQLRGLLAKLGKDAKAEPLRLFAARWAPLEAAAAARTEADALAGAQLDALLASAGATLPGKLADFAARWTGYPVGTRADAEYDRLAAAAQPALEQLTGEARNRARAKFVAKWTRGPTAAQVQAELESALATELAAITALDKPAQRAQRLQSFAKAWPDTAAGAAAGAALQVMIAEATAKQRK